MQLVKLVNVPLVERSYVIAVGENLLRTWKKAFEERGNDAFPGHGNLPPADDELRRLRAENARLKAERDLLKKAAAYFANPPS